METSAPKRRKTSPTTSVRVNSESNEPSSSDSATRRSSRLNRLSFASPTKASLARSNPDILQRRASSRARQSAEASPAPVPAASELGSPTSHHSSSNDPATTQLELGSEAGSLQRGHVGGKDNATVGRPGSPVRRAGGILSARPQRTHTKPSPRPLPPPSADEEELIDPFKGRKLRRSPPPGVFPAALRQAPEPEPELPPTPTQKGLSDPLAIITSPAGIHNTPSKRPRRSRALAAKMNSSPLKQPPLRPPESAAAAETAAQTVSLRLAKEPLRDEPKRKRRKRKSHPARQVEEADPLADKKALRDVLLAEVAQLEDDLRVAARENERLYRVQESRRHTTVELPNEEERSRLLDVLRRHVLPPEKETPPDPMRDWLEAAMNPIAFLPFGRNNAAALPPLPLPGSENENGKAGEGEEKDLSPPVSHHPVPITAEEELPYLQVFTPLTFTSTVTTTTTTTTRQNNAQEEEGQEQEQEPPLLQRHAISVSSSPRGLFFATIDMVVDTKTLSIARLAVPRLDPAALSELGPFLEKTLGGDGPTRNVGVVAWAMGEWVRVATKRARFWYAVSRELGSTEKILRCAEAMRRGTKRKGRGREVDRGGDDDGEDEEDGGRGRDGDAGGRGDKAPSKADVIALLGRTSLDIDLSGVACDGDGGGGDDDYESLVARIQWRIEFDWTGEARSKIGLLMSAPAKWRASDEKGSLAGLPDMFDKILQERKDPLEAVKIVVALIVGEGRRP